MHHARAALQLVCVSSHLHPKRQLQQHPGNLDMPLLFCPLQATRAARYAATVGAKMLAARSAMPPPRHAPRGDGALTAKPAPPEVAALPDAPAPARLSGGSPEAPRQQPAGIQAMLNSRAARHAAALSAFAAAKEAARAGAEGAAVAAGHKMAAALAEEEAEADGRFAMLVPGLVMRLSAQEIQQARI
jgi:hypothetical protein